VSESEAAKAESIEPHALAAAARELFSELTKAGLAVTGVACGEGRIVLRADVPDPGAPKEYRGYPVDIFTGSQIRK
jgi:hypothetical protein